MFMIIGADGKEYGPVTADQIRQWIDENRLTRDMQARRVETTAWSRIADLPEFGGTPSAEPNVGGVVPPSVPPTAGDAGTTSAAASPLAAPPGQPERIEFTGDWAEYFKIWIVNVLLTIVTLGIYAAWAKVRKRRYFCANTRVLGHTFEYLADPVKILYGNLIVVALFMMLTFSQFVSPFLYLALAIVFAIAVPWFVVRALVFNARNTAWRGLRFNFTGRYGESAKVFLLWPLLVPFTFGLLFPYVAKRQKDFVINHHAFGTSPFSFAGRTQDFYKIYGITLLFFIPMIVAYFAFIVAMVMTAQERGEPPNPAMAGSAFLFFLIALPFAIAGTFYFRARMFNLLWNNTSLAGNRFTATMRARDLFLIHLLNSIVTALTLGLMHPWAAVRVVKFQMDSLRLLPAGNIDAFLAAAHPPGSAVGEAANDFFDFDLGFGL
jgi:uncharacterized membrane protein YjgN (DUF898 family)